MTQMADALTRAGVKTPEQRLNEIALRALVRNASASDYTVLATEEIWGEVQKDRLLLIALFNRFGEYRNAIGLILHQLKHDIAVQEQKGRALGISEKVALKIVRSEREAERREEQERRAIDRTEQARKDAEYKEYLAGWHKTPFFDVKVGDTPIWQVSAGTVRAWLPTQRHKLRAIEMLIEGVPDDGRAIEFYRTPNDVREIWHILGEGDDA